MQTFILAIVATLFVSHHFYKKKAKRHLEKERVVLIGCSSGIGKELALHYASRGARLILFARRTALLKEVEASSLSRGATEAYSFSGDVTIENDLKRLKEFSQQQLGGVDTVIFCAGMLSVRPFLESSQISQAVEKVTSINYFAAVWTSRWFLPLLIETSVAPNLLVISSMAGKVGAPTRALYAGAKHALHGFFDSLRVEMDGKVHIGLVCPGTVDTQLRESAVDRSLGVSGSTKNKLSAADVALRIIKASDLREREIYLPAWFGYMALWAKLLASPLVDRFAARKYK
ncbi:hypothetical protein G6F56_008761 [Rhizopus delemar]|nr:hypothetical protein G6F56_008761 [Rhizopus delemar]